MNATLTVQEIKLGDTVWWRGSWGNEGWKEAKVKGIDLVRSGQKDNGIPIPWVPVEAIGSCVFDLDNGHWGYGYQIKPKEQTL